MPRKRRVVVALFLVVFSASAQPSPPPGQAAPMAGIARDQLCVTNGSVSALPGGELEVDTPSSRAVVRVPSAQTAEIRFRYLGPSAEVKPLASGELRRQIGLKLRAQDTCNLLYAMWHIEPDSRIAVSVKRNPGKRTHEQCGAHGYVNLKPRRGTAMSRVLPGEVHRLRAELHGTELSVFADGQLAWEGSVGGQVLEFDGPVGFRTDNARFAFAYFVSAAPVGERPPAVQAPAACVPSSGD
jgi:hypothetical protein